MSDLSGYVQLELSVGKKHGNYGKDVNEGGNIFSCSCFRESVPLVETTILQIVLDNDISDGFKHELNIIRVRGTGKVGVNFFLIFQFVQALKLMFDICGSILECVGSCEERWRIS